MSPAYPQFAAGERLVAETALGRDTAVLTDRRLIVAGTNLEQSMPLAAIGFVRVRFERMAREIVVGAAFVAVALVLFTLSGPTRAMIATQAAALESSAHQEQGEGKDGAPVMQIAGRLLRALAAIVGLVAPAALVLAAIGVVRIALGAFGRTVVTVGTGGGEVAFTRRGRDIALMEFVTEVGRQLPAPR